LGSLHRYYTGFNLSVAGSPSKCALYQYFRCLLCKQAFLLSVRYLTPARAASYIINLMERLKSYSYLSNVTLPYLVNIALITLIYFVSAKLGLSLAEDTKQVTTVWPPTAISLVILLLFGYRYWPGVFLGAFTANISTQEPFGIATAIAIGNTLEALAGAYLLRRFVDFNGKLETVKSVLGLVILAALFSTIISATIGTASLAAGGLIEWSNYEPVWLTWWIGDMIANLILAPFLIIVISRDFWRLVRENLYEAAILLILSSTAAVIAFTSESGAQLAEFSLAYLAFPFVIWGALRFREFGAISVTLIFTSVAVIGTINGLGPFNEGMSVEENLIFLYLFMGVLAVSSMLLGSAIAETKQSELDLMKRSEDYAEAESRLIHSLLRRRESERRRDQLISMASHELKTPLTSATVFSEILQRHLGKTPRKSKQALEYATRISGALDRLTKLTGDLIDVSRSRTGKLRLQMKGVDINILVAAVVADLKLIDQNHHMTIEGQAKRKVKIDEIRIRQVLVNLLNNAKAYSPVGSEIVVSIAKVDEDLIIKVIDSGPGIAKKERGRIFEAFYQKDDGRKGRAGFGLGLYVSRQIMDLHGGKIWVESSSGKGSTFAFSLPISGPSKLKK